MKYVAFSDESYLEEEGLKSIASFSLKADNLSGVNRKLRRLLEESSIKEFKWQKLKDARYRFCAQKLIEAVWELIQTEDARIDVITWDISDTRHKVKNRDDDANYGRMFYHLHTAALKRRPRSSTWRIFPDAGVNIDWNIVNHFLNHHGRKREEINLPLLAQSFFRDPYYSISDLTEINSHEEPCCQIADLFAGISIFSKANFELYKKWRDINNHNLSLPLFPKEELNLSKAQKERLPVLQYLDDGCKSRKLGVSLQTNCRLQTINPNNPINFWTYTPQHEMDKAPTKRRE